MQILSRSLNSYITKKAALIPWEAKSFAPETIEDLIKNYRERKIITIWDGASDNTIYGDPKVNFAFRAWHDYTHAILNTDFTLSGETVTALHQARQVGDKNGNIIIAEVVAQAQHFFDTGDFPADQWDFVLQAIN